MKSMGRYILCIAFVHINIHADELGYKITQPGHASIFADYIFAENEQTGNLLIFKMDKPDYGPSWLTGATLGGSLGLMFAQYKYPIIGNFPNKMKECVLVGAVLGIATCALINAYLPKHKPLKVFVIDASLSADKGYYAVQCEYNNELPYGPSVIRDFALRWIRTVKGGISGFANNEPVIKKSAEGNYQGDIKKNPKELSKVLLSVMY